MTRPEKEEPRSLLGRMAAGAGDRVLDIVDPNLVLDHVDINALLERIDLNRLLERVDVNALMDKLDIDALMERVDVEALVDRAGIPEIVVESTSHLTGSALDFFRRPLVGLDEIIFRGSNRLIGRDPQTFPEGPGGLVDWVDQHKEKKEGIKTGRYGGPLTRLFATLIDSAVVSFGFTLIVAGLVFVIGLFIDDFTLPANRGVYYAIGLGVFAFLYLWVSYAVFGKTIGKAILGLRVVSADGQVAMKGGQTAIRVLTYPISFIVFGIGLLGVVFNRNRQAWHDRFARTAVVYDWGSRTATMPTPLADYLNRKGAQV
jgi:uncharacterized RDD family membrane protein YckC